MINGKTLKSKKVLITGGLGFIGSNLAHKCAKLGAEVTIYDCLDPHAGGNLYNIRDIEKKVTFIPGDILNFDELVKYISGQDIIFNCAASTSHPFSMKEPWIDLDVNCRGAINLLEATRRFNRHARFIHIGTSTQIGKLHYRPADENHPEFPTDIYSANKSVSEKYVLLYANAYGIPATVIRFANVYGPRASIHSADFTFVNYFIGLALQNKNITVYKPGKQLRNITYIEDAVNALILAALSPKAIGEVYFAVSNDHISVAEIARTITEIIGGKLNLIDWPSERKMVEIGDAVISNKKITEQLAWKPVYDFKSGLIETKKYYSKCLKEYLPSK